MISICIAQIWASTYCCLISTGLKSPRISQARLARLAKANGSQAWLRARHQQRVAESPHPGQKHQPQPPRAYHPQSSQNADLRGPARSGLSTYLQPSTIARPHAKALAAFAPREVMAASEVPYERTASLPAGAQPSSRITAAEGSGRYAGSLWSPDIATSSSLRFIAERSSGEQQAARVSFSSAKLDSDGMIVDYTLSASQAENSAALVKGVSPALEYLTDGRRSSLVFGLRKAVGLVTNDWSQA